MTVENAPGRALVIGYGLSGRAAAGWLAARGWQVVVIEDDPRAAAAARALAADLRMEVAPGPARAAELGRVADLVVPSPGVRMSHPALVAAAASRVEVLSEIELAWSELVSRRKDGTYRLVAVTGTNGKTTVTQLVVAMLEASGLDAVAAGNVGYPLLEAVSALGAGPALAASPAGGAPAQADGPAQANSIVVAEVSSFQLEYTRRFRPDVSCWLNFAPDHLDWHPSLDHYASAKAKIWANQAPGSTIVVNADDPVVSAAAASAPAGTHVVTFGCAPGGLVPTGSYGPVWRVSPESVEGPDGLAVKAADLPRSFPHDLANTAAAMAVAVAAGATPQGCLGAARSTPAPAHRVQFVAEGEGASWYDDSKATTPDAVLAAARGFVSVVLIAGGRNKGLDLSPLAGAVPPVRAVVAIGESASEVAAVFAGTVPVLKAGSMEQAVEMAAGLAIPGDAVVLSPGCASFDWYSSYSERGEHFAALVKSRFQEVGS